MRSDNKTPANPPTNINSSLYHVKPRGLQELDVTCSILEDFEELKIDSILR
jgi:hypothetical protein